MPNCIIKRVNGASSTCTFVSGASIGAVMRNNGLDVSDTDSVDNSNGDELTMESRAVAGETYVISGNVANN